MASYIKVTNTVNLPVSFNPQTAFPLDARSMFGSYAEAVAAAATAENAGSSNTVYYIGQTLTVFENDAVNFYQIQPDKTIKPVGTEPVGDDKSITVTDGGKISIKSFGQQYYQYIPADTIIPTGSHTYPDNMPAEAAEGSFIKIGDVWYKYTASAWATTEEAPKTTAEYKLTTGWKAGLEPKVAQNAEGNGYEIAWYEPSTTTVEGLNSIVGSVQTQVENLTNVVSQNKTETDSKIAGVEKDYKAADDALDKRVAAVETTTTRLDGSAEVEGSVKNQIAAAIANIMNNPDETLNSIQELVDWVNNHETDVVTMGNDIAANKTAINKLETLVGTLPEGTNATDVIDYIKEAVDAEKTRALAAEGAISDKVTALETLTGKLGSAAQKDESYFAKADEVVKSVVAGETNGHIAVDGTDVKVYELEKASSNKLGGVKVDGTSITVSEDGTASVAAVDSSKVTGLADAISTAKTEAVGSAKDYTDENAVAKTDIVDSQSVSESVEAASETKVLSEKAILDMLTWKTIM